MAELRAEGLSDDVELVADMIEAETNLLEAIDLALAEMDEVEALSVGLKEKERQFLRRRQALEARGARLRALIEQAMATTEQRMLRRPSATLSLRTLPPQVVVVSEADIPSDYLRGAAPSSAEARHQATPGGAGGASRGGDGGKWRGPSALLVQRDPGRHPQQWWPVAAGQAGLMGVALQTSGLRPHQIALLKQTIAADCRREEFELFIETAQRSGLDPFRRQIVPLILGRHDQRRMVVMVTLEGLRVIANRCGNYRAASEPARYVTDRRRKGPANPLGLVLARVKLWQQDLAGTWFPIAGEAYWDEFAPLRHEAEGMSDRQAALDPASPWARMPRLMLAKCATAQALRAGWPEEFGGLYSEEEMERARLLDASVLTGDVSPARPKDCLTVTWDGAALEQVSLAEFGDRAAAWLSAAGRTADDVTAWAETNRHALREFWGCRPAEALQLKRLVEARSRGAELAVCAARRDRRVGYFHRERHRPRRCIGRASARTAGAACLGRSEPMKSFRIRRPATAFSRMPRQRRPRERARSHLKWIATLPCAICLAEGRSQAAHIRLASAAHGKRAVGLGEKPDDCWTVPLCVEHHLTGMEAQHRMVEADFWRQHRRDPFSLALALWRFSGDEEAAGLILREVVRPGSALAADEAEA